MFLSVIRHIVAYLSLCDNFIPNLKIHHNLDIETLANTPPKLFNQSDHRLIQRNDNDDSSTYAIRTPPKPVVVDLLDDHDPLGGVGACDSWPDSIYIIRSVVSGHVITLHDGQIALTPPGGRGSIHWACVENKGWLGFRNIASGKFLGHDANGRLKCSAERHQGWENFYVRGRPEGGYVLLMQHWDRLWHVGIKVEHGVEKLAKIGDGGAGGIAWEFVRV